MFDGALEECKNRCSLSLSLSFNPLAIVQPRLGQLVCPDCHDCRCFGSLRCFVVRVLTLGYVSELGAFSPKDPTCISQRKQLNATRY